MAFTSNPLSLSVPEPAFETWLRDTGYLHILDQRTTDLHRLNSTTTTTSSTATTSTTLNHQQTTSISSPTTTLSAAAYGLTMSFIYSISTLLSIFTLNPFSKLTSSDFHPQNAVVWTSSGFIASIDSYSFPSSSNQARMRVHENVKRFAQNYAALLILFFASALYKMPLALVGLLSCLAIWELFRFCDERWALNQIPAGREVIIRIAQFVGVVLLYTNVPMAVFWALAVGYAVMILHASFRKLTPAKQPSNKRGR